MKALPSTAATRRVIKQEVAREMEQYQIQMQDDISRQMLAVMLYSLHVRFGFGKKRLREIFDEIDSTFSDMSGIGIVKPFDTDDLIARCKDDFGIDLMAEVHSVAPKVRDES